MQWSDITDTVGDHTAESNEACHYARGTALPYMCSVSLSLYDRTHSYSLTETIARTHNARHRSRHTEREREEETETHTFTPNKKINKTKKKFRLETKHQTVLTQHQDEANVFFVWSKWCARATLQNVSFSFPIFYDSFYLVSLNCEQKEFFPIFSRIVWTFFFCFCFFISFCVNNLLVFSILWVFSAIKLIQCNPKWERIKTELTWPAFASKWNFLRTNKIENKRNIFARIDLQAKESFAIKMVNLGKTKISQFF